MFAGGSEVLWIGVWTSLAARPSLADSVVALPAGYRREACSSPFAFASVMCEKLSDLQEPFRQLSAAPESRVFQPFLR